MRRADTDDGLYKTGNPDTGEKGTRVTFFFNDVQEELCNAIEEAGLVLDGDQRTQLLQAILLLATTATFTDIGGSGKKCRLAFRLTGQAADGSDMWAIEPQTVA